MSSQAPSRPNPKWVINRAKVYGWLTGLFLAAFGGLMCSVPVGAYLGVPVVVVGLLMCLSFTVAMSASAVPSFVTLPLVVGGLALLVVGRRLAPVDQIIESFRVGEELINNPGPAGAFGIPIMIIGYALIAAVIPWVRQPDRLSYGRSLLSMILIQTGAVLLLVGVVVTASSSAWQEQPHWIWIAVPVLFGLGTGFRNRWTGSRWLVVASLTGAVLPLIWYLLA